MLSFFGKKCDLYPLITTTQVIEKREEIKNYNIWQPFLLSVIMIMGMVLGYKMNDADNPPLIQGIDMDESSARYGSGRVEEIIRFVDTRYVDEVDDSDLVESAITAVLDQLDPHSVYIAPEYMKSINASMEGQFKGVGIESYYLDDTVNIISVLKDSPADKAGLERFDQIIAINDIVVAGKGLPFSDISDMLSSEEEDKEVQIHKYRSKTEERVQLSITEIPLGSVEIFYMLTDKVGLIKIDRFSSKTYKEFMEALEDLVENQNLRHLVIDLRNNPGGYLPETTNILSQLMKEKDRLLVYTEGKANDRIDYTTTGKSFFNVERIAVLIDENSASGSEILAGALQDWDRGLVVGRRTFGKGLVQEQYPLSNGGAIRLTVARYYTPTGRSIQQSYDNLNDYHDVSKRYSSDTIQIVDSLKYYTKILGREVYGSGGIYPDVYVPISAADEDPGLISILSQIPEWTYMQLRDDKLNFEGTIEQIVAWELPTEVLQSFNEYVSGQKNQFASGYLNNYVSVIRKEIKAQMARILFGEIAENKVQIIGDKALDEALNYVQSDNSLEEYLESYN